MIGIKSNDTSNKSINNSGIFGKIKLKFCRFLKELQNYKCMTIVTYVVYYNKKNKKIMDAHRKYLSHNQFIVVSNILYFLYNNIDSWQL